MLSSGATAFALMIYLDDRTTCCERMSWTAAWPVPMWMVLMGAIAIYDTWNTIQRGVLIRISPIEKYRSRLFFGVVVLLGIGYVAWKNFA